MSKHYIPGMHLPAKDLNEAFARIERLEKLQGDGYLKVEQSAFSQHISFTKDIPEIEFIRLAVLETLDCDRNQVVEGRLLYYNSTDDVFEEQPQGESTTAQVTVNARNLFKFVQNNDADFIDCCIVRFPRFRGEWIIIAVTNPCLQ